MIGVHTWVFPWWLSMLLLWFVKVRTDYTCDMQHVFKYLFTCMLLIFILNITCRFAPIWCYHCTWYNSKYKRRRGHTMFCGQIGIFIGDKCFSSHGTCPIHLLHPHRYLWNLSVWINCLPCWVLLHYCNFVADSMQREYSTIWCSWGCQEWEQRSAQTCMADSRSSVVSMLQIPSYDHIRTFTGNHLLDSLYGVLRNG